MAKTIYMIHGMWGGPWYWNNFKTFFSEKGYQVITPTLRHHDIEPHEEPDPALGTTSLLDYAADLEADIKKLPKKPILMGHSMGGLLAMILASRNLASTVVAITPASPAGINAITPSVIKSFLSIMTKWAFWKKPMRQTFHEAAYSILNILPPEEQKEAYDKFVFESGRAAFEIGYWFLDRQRASGIDESSIAVPLLIIGGKEDRITPVSVTRRFAKRFSGQATYRELENHAHWAMAEPGWQQIAGDTAAWLEEKLA